MTNEAAYKLVLMDCQMPEMDGYEASEAIRNGLAGEENKSIPIIAMTANAMKGDKEKCLAAGMSDYTSKPIDPEKLVQALTKWLSYAKEEPLAQQTAQNVEDNESPVHTWDQAAFSKRLNNNQAILSKIVASFILDVPIQYDQLKAAAEQRDLDAIHFIAHTMKGIAGNLSAEQLSIRLAELESIRDINDLPLLDKLIIEIEDDLGILLIQLNQFLDQ